MVAKFFENLPPTNHNVPRQMDGARKTFNLPSTISLTPLDLHLWDRIKLEIYVTGTGNNIKELLQRVQEASSSSDAEEIQSATTEGVLLTVHSP